MIFLSISDYFYAIYYALLYAIVDVTIRYTMLKLTPP